MPLASRRVLVVLPGVLMIALGCNRTPPPSQSSPGSTVTTVPIAVPVAEKNYLERLAGFKTKLIHTCPRGVQEVTYQSGDLALKAWVAFPKTATPGAKVPGVIFFHGGFAFGASDFADALPFLKAGMAVMCPTLRGENGNPGAFELYLGEVNDAKAAVAWFAANEKIDASHLYTFGHSAGGVRLKTKSRMVSRC